MRIFLPKFRLLTLKPEEAVELPKFLTYQEEAALLRFFITRDVKGLPETLNTLLQTRNQLLNESTRRIKPPVSLSNDKLILYYTNQVCMAHPGTDKNGELRAQLFVREGQAANDNVGT